MSGTLQDTNEWRLGRRGEILADITLSRHGFTLLDAAGSGGRATTLHRYEADLVSPDMLGVMTRPLWFEIKTKTQNWIWRGGSPPGLDAAPRMPSGPAQGIDQVAYLRYKAVQHTTQIPVVLLLIIIETAEMYANSLASLGEPFLSVNNDLRLVNWPLASFVRLYSFNPNQLHQYFYEPGSSVARMPPDNMPSPSQRELWFERLRPIQHELEGLRQHLFTIENQRWAG